MDSCCSLGAAGGVSKVVWKQIIQYARGASVQDKDNLVGMNLKRFGAFLKVVLKDV